MGATPINHYTLTEAGWSNDGVETDGGHALDNVYHRDDCMLVLGGDGEATVLYTKDCMIVDENGALGSLMQDGIELPPDSTIEELEKLT